LNGYKPNHDKQFEFWDNTVSKDTEKPTNGACKSVALQFKTHDSLEWVLDRGVNGSGQVGYMPYPNPIRNSDSDSGSGRIWILNRYIQVPIKVIF